MHTYDTTAELAAVSDDEELADLPEPDSRMKPDEPDEEEDPS